jgi:tRNA (cmo5U34)-methyltransferase
VSNEKDNIYAAPLAEPGLFAFDQNVARVFPDMIKRSVPGYTTIIAMTGLMAGRYARQSSVVYDLGCSLGASTLAKMKGDEEVDAGEVETEEPAAVEDKEEDSEKA